MYIREINNWFNNYDKWVHQAERAERLGIAWTQEDKLLKVTYHSLLELDRKAEEMKVKLIEIKEEQQKQMLEWRRTRGG